MNTPLKSLLLATLTASLMSSVYAGNSGETLFKQKCLSCHTLSKPDDLSTLVAPPIQGVMRHVKMRYPSKDDAVAFIVDYALNPHISKALCNADKIKRFGLMPSQQGRVTPAQLHTIAEWMYDTAATQKQSEKQCHSKQKQGAKTSKAATGSQFLIASGMPHLTKLLMQQWENKTLALSPEQKKRLLVVRDNTMKEVKRITPRIKGLEKTIIRKTMAKESPKIIEPMVKKLAQLKAQATNVHVRCIYETLGILTQKQMAELSK